MESIFDKEFLTSIVNGDVADDMPSISSIVGRLKDIRTIMLEADFDHYGSGTCSYVPVYISKRDKLDIKISNNGNLTTYTTNGLVLYLCRHAPYATYGKGEWSKTFEGEECRNRSVPFIQEIGSLPSTDWEQRIIEISNILNTFKIAILTKEELDVKLDFEIKIPTEFSKPRSYRIFDCFFYWTD